MYATAEKEGEEDAAVFEGSPEVIFIVLHSSAHVMMKVRDRREGGFFGTVSAIISSICVACLCPPLHSVASGEKCHPVTACRALY